MAICSEVTLKLQILDFALSANHIQLLIGDSDKDVAPYSLQLVADKTAQEVNN